MKEIAKSAVAIFDEDDNLIRVDVFNSIPYSTALKQVQKRYIGADFKLEEKPAPVTLEVHGSNFRPRSKFNKTKP
jgi:hypothetical protein